MDESVVRDIAGKLALFFWNLPINSAAICCASAALPPLPRISNLFPFDNDFTIMFTEFSISFERMDELDINDELSEKIFKISFCKVKISLDPFFSFKRLGMNVK